MEKALTVVTRKLDGSFDQKVTIFGTMDDAKNVLMLMSRMSKKIIKGEIYEGQNLYFGDCRVRPVEEITLDMKVGV